MFCMPLHLIGPNRMRFKNSEKGDLPVNETLNTILGGNSVVQDSTDHNQFTKFFLFFYWLGTIDDSRRICHRETAGPLRSTLSQSNYSKLWICFPHLVDRGLIVGDRYLHQKCIILILEYTPWPMSVLVSRQDEYTLDQNRHKHIRFIDNGIRTLFANSVINHMQMFVYILTINVHCHQNQSSVSSTHGRSVPICHSLHRSGYRYK